MSTQSESPLVARVRALVAMQGTTVPQSSLEAMEASLGRETDPQKIVILAREIDAIKAKQNAARLKN